MEYDITESGALRLTLNQKAQAEWKEARERKGYIDQGETILVCVPCRHVSENKLTKGIDFPCCTCHI